MLEGILCIAVGVADPDVPERVERRDTKEPRELVRHKPMLDDDVDRDGDKDCAQGRGDLCDGVERDGDVRCWRRIGWRGGQYVSLFVLFRFSFISLALSLFQLLCVKLVLR